MKRPVNVASEIVFRTLGRNDLRAVATLRDEILSHLPHPADYIAHVDEDGFLESHVGAAGLCIGIEAHGRLGGFSLLTLDVRNAHLDPELVAAIARHNGGNQSFDRTCVLAATMLHPDFRGKGLHREAIGLRLKIALERGRSKGFAMSSPWNTASLCNLLRMGARIRDLLSFADGRLRYLAIVTMRQQQAPTSGQPPVLVRIPDCAAQRVLFEAGYVGERIVAKGEELFLELHPRATQARA